MRKENYQYQVIILDREDGTCDINIKDFNTTIEQVEKDKAVEIAREWIGKTINQFEKNKVPVPKETPITNIKNPIKGISTIIDIWMPYWRAQDKITYTKKTLTLPSWLEYLANEKNLNFSRVLENALRRELGIDNE